MAFALQRMAPHVPDAELGPLVSFALGERLRVDGLPGLVDRAVAAGSLQPYTLAEAVREGHVSLAQALAAAGARDAVIFSLAGLYRPGDDTPQLAEIVRLLASTASWGRGLDDGRYDVETLLWRVDMPAAEASGLRQQLDELIERSGGDLVGFLVHASFTAASGPTDGEPAFRTWLAARIEPRLADESLQLAVVKAIDEPANFARLRPIALRLAERATARDLVQVMLSAKSESAAATIDVFHAFLATAPPSSDPDLAVVREAMARLRAIDTLGPLRSDELLDLAYAHLTR